MGLLRPTRRVLVTGRDRGQYIDYNPYNTIGYVRPGQRADRTFDVNESVGHIFDANSFGNTMNNGHFYARYRIWGCRIRKQDESRAPRLRWSFIVNILKTSPDTETLQWEMRKQLDLLLQSSHYANLSEICGLVQCHLKHSQKITSTLLCDRIQHRLNSFSPEEISESVVAISPIRAYGFLVTAYDNLSSKDPSKQATERIRQMLLERKEMLDKQLSA